MSGLNGQTDLNFSDHHFNTTKLYFEDGIIHWADYGKCILTSDYIT